MSSLTDLPTPKPLYSREMLADLEAQLCSNDEYIRIQNGAGKIVHIRIANMGGSSGDSDSDGTHNKKKRCFGKILFNDERHLLLLGPNRFFPVTFFSYGDRGNNDDDNQKDSRAATVRETEAQIRAKLSQALQDFERSAEAAAITDLVTTRLRGHSKLNKVIAFGLGELSHRRSWPQRYYEHAAALVVAQAARAVSSVPVALLVQEPAYSDACTRALSAFGADVIGGFGAKGFTLVDDDTIVLSHHPDFPLRSIIADLARPALICMRARKPGDDVPRITATAATAAAAARSPAWDPCADPETPRSWRMLETYRGYFLPVPTCTQKAFWDNAWYVRDPGPILGDGDGDDDHHHHHYYDTPSSLKTLSD